MNLPCLSFISLLRLVFCNGYRLYRASHDTRLTAHTFGGIASHFGLCADHSQDLGRTALCTLSAADTFFVVDRNHEHYPITPFLNEIS